MSEVDSSSRLPGISRRAEQVFNTWADTERVGRDGFQMAMAAAIYAAACLLNDHEDIRFARDDDLARDERILLPDFLQGLDAERQEKARALIVSKARLVLVGARFAPEE